MGDPPQPRENIINTAVSFLQNPKVQNSPVEHQQQFLRKKGLSEEEIGIAFERTRIVSENRVLVPPPSTVVPIPDHLALPLQSKWTKVWDFFNTLMFVAGVSYSLYYLYKKFLAPLLFGKKDKKPTVEESVITIQESVSKSINEVKESLREVRETLDSQQQELIRVALLRQDGVDVNVDVSVQRTLHDLKAEVTSIKGLLLNRKQFPSTPNPSPSIPAWQMSQDNNDNNGKSGTAGESAESSSPTSEYYKVRDLEELCVSGSSETVMINKSEVTGEGSDSSLEMVRE